MNFKWIGSEQKWIRLKKLDFFPTPTSPTSISIFVFTSTCIFFFHLHAKNIHKCLLKQMEGS